MLKVGIVGAGFMGGMHSNVYANLPKTKLVAVADLSAERAKELNLPEDAAIYSSIEELLEKVDVDLVDICLPTYLHAENVVKAAQAGKHILCEKPMAMTLDEADAMIEATEKAGVSFMVGHCIRFWPEYQVLKDIVDKGTLGQLTSLFCSRLSPTPTWSWDNWLLEPKRSKSATLDLHIHDTDYILYLLGKPISVFSRGRKDEKGWVHIFTGFKYASNIAVAALGGWDLPASFPFNMAFLAAFERGVVEMDLGKTPTLTVYEADKEEPYALPLPKPEVEAVESGGNISELGGYFSEIQYFTDCILAGEKPTIVTPQTSRDSLETVLAEIESVETGKEVFISD